MESKQLQEIELSETLSVDIFTDGSIIEGGGVIWDAAHVLSRFIAKNPKGFREYFEIYEEQGLKVIELGAGTGYCGISMAQVFQNAEVILTEMSQGSLRLMDETIKHNKLFSRVKTDKLNWGEDAEKMSKFREMKLDFIIGSDIIYIEHAFPLLAETILQLSSQDTKTIIANADHGNLRKFEEFIRSGPYSQKLLLQEIEKEWQHELFQADDIKIYLIQPI